MAHRDPNFRKLTPFEKGYVDLMCQQEGYKYVFLDNVTYESKKYNKKVTIKHGDLSDGATGAADINSLAWWVHDQLCRTGLFDDGSLCTNWQASKILRHILWEEWSFEHPFRIIRGLFWSPATWLFGGGKCRLNGMW